MIVSKNNKSMQAEHRREPNAPTRSGGGGNGNGNDDGRVDSKGGWHGGCLFSTKFFTYIYPAFSSMIDLDRVVWR